jgi:hypothetical protein
LWRLHLFVLPTSLFWRFCVRTPRLLVVAIAVSIAATPVAQTPQPPAAGAPAAPNPRLDQYKNDVRYLDRLGIKYPTVRQ